MYKCSITNKKKNKKKEVPMKSANVVDKKKTSRKKPRKPGKFIWLIMERVRRALKEGRK
jgi:hypothetical protein